MITCARCGGMSTTELATAMDQLVCAKSIEVLMIGQPDFTWSEVFLAIDRLSRKQEIALARRGSTYQLTVNR